MNETAKGASEDVTLKTVKAGEMFAPTPSNSVPAYRGPVSPHQSMELQTADGQCPAHLFRPEGDGPWPAVLFLMDGFGIRSRIMEMAQRLADGGYLVLLPDLFYRVGPYEPLDVPAIFASGNLLEEVRSKLGTSPTVAMALSDAPAFLTFLRAHPDAAGTSIGVTGYCMSGGMSLAIAGKYGADVAGAACFHGGLLVSESPDSPHMIAASAEGELYVGGAQTDQWCPPEMVAQLDEALTSAEVKHRCDIYEGTMHGWTMRDSPVYNEAAAERHWQELFALFARTLDGGPLKTQR